MSSVYNQALAWVKDLPRMGKKGMRRLYQFVREDDGKDRKRLRKKSRRIKDTGFTVISDTPDDSSIELQSLLRDSIGAPPSIPLPPTPPPVETWSSPRLPRSSSFTESEYSGHTSILNTQENSLDDPMNAEEALAAYQAMMADRERHRIYIPVRLPSTDYRRQSQQY